jgi:hypothetical protein
LRVVGDRANAAVRLVVVLDASLAVECTDLVEVQELDARAQRIADRAAQQRALDPG